jgi:hypothetical protein
MVSDDIHVPAVGACQGSLALQQQHQQVGSSGTAAVVQQLNHPELLRGLDIPLH